MLSSIPVIDKMNALWAIVVTILSYALGVHWYLFVAYLILNVVDHISGCIRSRLKGEITSKKGTLGILKKVGYWMMILVSFLMSAVFIELGSVIGVDLKITASIGWLVLAALIVNELRSIIENFVEAGYEVPSVLTKGLAAASKMLDDIEDKEDD